MSPRKSFKYSGLIESSKSIVNRALILQAIHPNLKIKYTSQAQDILDLERCLNLFKNHVDQNLKNETKTKDLVLDVGSGGTTFRFLTLFLSKYLGTWHLKLSNQLSKRPHDDLMKILKQLGVFVEFHKNMESSNESSLENQGGLLTLKSNFWQSDKVDVDFSKSSQFFTGLALAASDSKKPFIINCNNRDQSSGYEFITLELLKQMGVQVLDQGESIQIQNPGIDPVEINVGADWSSVIYILSFCFSGAEIEITNLDLKSPEPDLKGLEFLKQMGLELEIEASKTFTILKAKPSQLNSKLRVLDLKNNPDLFPQLVVLLSQMASKHGVSVQVEYMNQLIYKESDRLNVMIEILIELGFKVKIEKQILTIQATSDVEVNKSTKDFNFNSKSDHRLIMCFELLKSFGYNIHYSHKDEVKKSFSNFFEIIYGA